MPTRLTLLTPPEPLDILVIFSVPTLARFHAERRRVYGLYDAGGFTPGTPFLSSALVISHFGSVYVWARWTLVTPLLTKGVFLSTTRRMYDDVCDFISQQIYEGRLDPHDDYGR